jgi:hypothetical protein
MKSFTNFTNLCILIFILIVVGILYKRFEDKRIQEETQDSYEAIQKYLLDDVTLGKSKKPILWLHVPYEYNSRKWLDFGSRSSFDLNQPYLYLTVKSILKQCDKSFTICMIDDNTFQRLIPGWNIHMSSLSDPILSNMRTLGLTKLLYIYGGLICPISFVCMKDLIGLYNKGTSGGKMFFCETTDRNITSTEFDYYPSISFCGAPKECETVKELCDFIQRISSEDYTAASVFLGDFDRWSNARIRSRKINLIDGIEIGTKTIEEKPIVLDHLMSNHYLQLYPGTYGILIPANEVLNRRKYEWFSRMSAKQVMQSDTILGNYLLLANSPEPGILEPYESAINHERKNSFVGFWRTPNYPGLYGLKPNFLGDHLQKAEYTGR